MLGEIGRVLGRGMKIEMAEKTAEEVMSIYKTVKERPELAVALLGAVKKIVRREKRRMARGV